MDSEKARGYVRNRQIPSGASRKRIGKSWSRGLSGCFSRRPGALAVQSACAPAPSCPSVASMPVVMIWQAAAEMSRRLLWPLCVAELAAGLPARRPSRWGRPGAAVQNRKRAVPNAAASRQRKDQPILLVSGLSVSRVAHGRRRGGRTAMQNDNLHPECLGFPDANPSCISIAPWNRSFFHVVFYGKVLPHGFSSAVRAGRRRRFAFDAQARRRVKRRGEMRAAITGQMQPAGAPNPRLR